MELKSLDSLVAHFRCQTYAESTKKTYQTYLKAYLEFCTKFDVNVVPLSSVNLARYIAFLSRRLKFNSITNYLNIVRLLHVEAGLTSPVDSVFIDSVLKGAKRVLGSDTNRKFPITTKILYAIFSILPLDNSKDLCFWTACLVAFFSFLRKSNLFPDSLPAFNPQQHLSRHNIHFCTEGVRLRLFRTKTIQYSERTLDIPLPRIPNSPLCPSKALLLNFKQVKPSLSPSPAFLFLSSGKVNILTYPLFLTMLKCYLHRLGYDSSNFSGHSFRRGGASFALECGISSELIQSQGDWKSDAYKNYLDPSFSYRKKVMNKFASALARP